MRHPEDGHRDPATLAWEILIALIVVAVLVWVW
jgi:hypothetical protein